MLTILADPCPDLPPHENALPSFMKPVERVAGVLGGMGPDATVDFMSKVIALSGGKSDQDHIRMIVDHNPKVPDRQAAIFKDAEDPGPVLADMARGLEAAGADFLVMVCNSAHAFSKAVRQATALPLVSIIDVTLQEVLESCPDARRAGLLATDGLIASGIYQDALEAAGLEPVLPRDEDLESLMVLIRKIKAGDRSSELTQEMGTLAELLASAGAEVIIAGCTEIPLVLNAPVITVPVISSTDALARKTVALARGLGSLDPFLRSVER
jgi:aspartate racemase